MLDHYLDTTRSNGQMTGQNSDILIKSKQTCPSKSKVIFRSIEFKSEQSDNLIFCQDTSYIFNGEVPQYVYDLTMNRHVCTCGNLFITTAMKSMIIDHVVRTNSPLLHFQVTTYWLTIWAWSIHAVFLITIRKILYTLLNTTVIHSIISISSESK